MLLKSVELIMMHEVKYSCKVIEEEGYQIRKNHLKNPQKAKSCNSYVQKYTNKNVPVTEKVSI